MELGGKSDNIPFTNQIVFNIRHTNNSGMNLSHILSDEVNYNLDLSKLNPTIIHRLVTALIIDYF